MRDTNIFFLNASAPAALVRFDAPPGGGSLIFFDESSSVLYVNIPADYDFTANPTKELFDRLNELKTKYSTASLPNSEPPSDRAFLDARRFILTLPLTQIVKPMIQIASDGEVNFQWSGTDFQIDLGFYGNEKFSFYAAKDGHAPILGDDVPVKTGIPKALVDFASTI